MCDDNDHVKLRGLSKSFKYKLYSNNVSLLTVLGMLVVLTMVGEISNSSLVVVIHQLRKQNHRPRINVSPCSEINPANAAYAV